MVRFSGVHLTYANGTKAIKGIDLQINDGEFVFLIGPSGSGKSTIVKMITGELRPTQGRVIVNGF
ncbi:MAG: ATP-binding cassette domain-containing protein, partial [Clostridiales bacterium]|nr:ATP-binding cassette domain-containing protein [Clostridiales bacterium]